MAESPKEKLLAKIGQVIYNKRLETGLSRIKIAIELNTDEKQIRRIENGEINTSLITILKLFTLLKIDFEVLNKFKNDKSLFVD